MCWGLVLFLRSSQCGSTRFSGIRLLAELAENEEPVHLVHKHPEVSFLNSRRAVAPAGDGPLRAGIAGGAGTSS